MIVVSDASPINRLTNDRPRSPLRIAELLAFLVGLKRERLAGWMARNSLGG